MTLHPQAQAFIDALVEQDPPGWEELGVEASREAFNGLSSLFGEAPELPVVENIHLAGDVPARIYKPSNDSGLPVVVFYHGGGWVLGGLESHDALCRRLAQGSGAAVVAIDYGLAPDNPFPGPLDQCYRATQDVSERASELGLDAGRLWVAGDSAGGNLAAAVSIRARDQQGPSVTGQVLMYPVIAPDFETESYQRFAEGHGLTRSAMRWFWNHYMSASDHLEVPLADLRKNDLDGLPPALVITAEYDVLRDEGESFADRLESSGVPVSRSQYAGMLHGFIHFAGAFDPSADALNEVSCFIQANG